MIEPKLRFKADDGSDFPDWEEKTLGELFSISAGGDIDRDNSSIKRSQDYPYSVYANSLSNHGLYGYANYYKIDGDTFTVTGRGDVGWAVARHGKYVPIVRLLVCQPKAGDNVDFFAAQVNSTRIFIESTGVPQLTAPQLAKVKIKRPSLPEQRKIADLLSTVDDVIAAQQAEVDAWERRKKGVMQKLFSQEVRFKADDGSDFPDWEEKTLGDLGEFIKGAPLSKADIAPEGNPMILYGELYTTYGEVAYEIARSTNRNVDDKYRSKIGDVLIPTSGETPEEISTATCVMKEGVILAGDLYIYRTVDEIDGRIMSYLLNHQANKAISCIAQGKSVVHVQAKELRNITVVFPFEMGEQRKIADCLASMDEVIQKSKDELAKWQELKKGLLQQMFV